MSKEFGGIDATLAAWLHAQPMFIEVAVSWVSDSCGFGAPLMDLVAQRPLLPEWAARRSPAGIADYQATRNRASVDGLPGLGAG